MTSLSKQTQSNESSVDSTPACEPLPDPKTSFMMSCLISQVQIGMRNDAEPPQKMGENMIKQSHGI